MKMLLLTLIAILLSTFSVQAQKPLYQAKLQVGQKPFYIKLIEGEKVLVLCEGVDLNNNGIFEEGDEYPSAWVIFQYHITAIEDAEYKENDNFPGFADKLCDFEMGALSYPFMGQIYVNPKHGNVDLYFILNDVVYKKDYLLSSYDCDIDSVFSLQNNQVDFIRASQDIIAICSNSGESDEIKLVSDNKIIADKTFSYQIVDIQYDELKYSQYTDKSKLVILGETEDGNGVLEVYSNEYFELIDRTELTGKPKSMHVSEDYISVAYEDKIEIDWFFTDKLSDSQKIISSNEISMIPSLTNVDGNQRFGLLAVYNENNSVYTVNVPQNNYLAKFEMPNKTHSICSYDYGYFAQAGMYLADDVTPNDTVLLYYYVYEDVAQEELNPTQIYPNPTADKLTVELEENFSGDCTVQILDITGQICAIKSILVNCNLIDINIRDYDLSTGAYFIKLDFADKTYTGKFVVGE